MYCYYEADTGNHAQAVQAGERQVIKIKFSFTGKGLCAIIYAETVKKPRSKAFGKRERFKENRQGCLSPSIKQRLSTFFTRSKVQQADQAVPVWTGIRGFAMEGMLRQRWDALLYGEKLILSEEETTSAGGCGVFSAAFSRPAPTCP